VVAASTLAVVAVGGDCMPAHRFFAHTTPLVCVLAASCIAHVPALARRWRTTVAILAACNVVLWRLDPAIERRIADDQIAYWGRQVGVWMRAHLPPDAVVAVNTAGSVPYYSRLRVIDMLGLNDAHIGHRQLDLGKGIPGHEKADGAYVLARRPDYIQLGSPLGSRRAQFLSDRELWRHPAFHQAYADTAFALPSGRSFVLWVRRR
jgi:hypothetical protein